MPYRLCIGYAVTNFNRSLKQHVSKSGSGKRKKKEICIGGLC